MKKATIRVVTFLSLASFLVLAALFVLTAEPAVGGIAALNSDELQQWVGGVTTIHGYLCEDEKCGGIDENGCSVSDSVCTENNVGAVCRFYKDWTPVLSCKDTGVEANTCEHDNSAHCYVTYKCTCEAAGRCRWYYGHIPTKSELKADMVCGTWNPTPPEE